METTIDPVLLRTKCIEFALGPAFEKVKDTEEFFIRVKQLENFIKDAIPKVVPAKTIIG